MKKFTSSLLFTALYIFSNTAYSQDIRNKNIQSISAGLQYSAGIIDPDFAHIGALGVGYNILFPITNAWAFETGIHYQAALVFGINYSQEIVNNDGNVVGTFGDDSPQLYHMGRIPLMLSKKMGRRGSDRMYMGLNACIPLYQPVLTSIGEFKLKSDLLIPYLTAEAGYRFQLESESYFSIGMAFNLTRMSSFETSTGLNDDRFTQIISGRLIHLNFSYHYFFGN